MSQENNMKHYIYLLSALLLLLTGCAANQLHGYQPVYKKYEVPETLIAQIKQEFKSNGLQAADVMRDNTGRVKLVGEYLDEDEVDKAFLISQSIVGIKSTSPIYPDKILQRRWEIGISEGLLKMNPKLADYPQKRALIIGINRFRDRHISSIGGEDDARRVKEEASKNGYLVTALFGEQATKRNIKNALDNLISEVRPNDTVMIYISSHGYGAISNGGDSRKMSIVAYDSDASGNNPVKFYQTTVPDTDIVALTHRPTANAAKTYAIIDTCYSGDMLSGFPESESSRFIIRTNNGYAERISPAPNRFVAKYESKGIVFNADEAPNSSYANSKPEVYEANNTVFITATSGGQKSWGPKTGVNFVTPNGATRKGSFFTQAFFDYLTTSKGNVVNAFNQAKDWTVNKVTNIPKEIAVSERIQYPIKQTPVMAPYNINDRSTL